MVFTIKKETFKKRPKNQNFPKGLVHTFRQKLELFSGGFFFKSSNNRQTRPEKEKTRKDDFYKNQKHRTLWVYAFCEKIVVFSLIVFLGAT